MNRPRTRSRKGQKAVVEEQARALDQAKAKGMTILTPKAEDFAALRAQARSGGAEIAKITPQGLAQELKSLLEQALR